MRRIGFGETTRSHVLIDRTLAEVAGTLLTAELALAHGLACNTAGGKQSGVCGPAAAYVIQTKGNCTGHGVTQTELQHDPSLPLQARTTHSATMAPGSASSTTWLSPRSCCCARGGCSECSSSTWTFTRWEGWGRGEGEQGGRMGADLETGLMGHRGASLLVAAA